MQKVSSILPSWDKTKSGGKKGFDKVWGWADKLGAPVNRLTNKIGSEAFWPTSLDKESDKAARILKSFCKDGFYAQEDRPTNIDGPKSKQRVLKKIPQKVIQNAVGLAIFTTMRSGFWISGAGGSGVLIARQEDGNWSPPSGILLHTAGLGFLVGVDIYDCVVVINNRKALEAFTKIRATLGGEISAVAGPVGVGGILENDGKWKQANRPVFTYLKSRGFYAGVQVDGTVIIERSDENEKFYGQRIGVADILAGKARHPPPEIKMLMETVKAAEGRSDVDQAMMEELDGQPAPGDVDLETPPPYTGPIFGIPEADDPDPYGVLALEKEGFEIREAGSQSRPASSQFEYNPSPTSPVFSRFHRRSVDTLVSRSNRESFMSNRSSRGRLSIDRGMQTMEMGTQTDDLSPSSSPIQSIGNGMHRMIIEEDEKAVVLEPEEVDYTKIDLGPFAALSHNSDLDGSTVHDSPQPEEDEHHMDSSYASEDEEEEEEPVVFEAASAQATFLTAQSIKARGGVVNIPKRPPPPPLPPRNNARVSKGEMVDHACGQSPMIETFEEVDLHAMNRNSVEQSEPEKAIVMQDLEKDREHKDLEDTPAVETKRLSEDVKVADATPAHKDENDEMDTFHSIPTTPNETFVQPPMITSTN